MAMATCCVSFGASTIQRYVIEYCYVTPVKTIVPNYRSKVLLKLTSNGPVTNKLVYFYLFNRKYKTGTTMNNIRPKDESGEASATFSSKLLIQGESNRIRIFYSDSDGTINEIWFDEIFDDYVRQVEVNNLANLEYRIDNIPAYTKEKGNFVASNRYFFENCYSTNNLTIFNKFDIEHFTLSEKIDDIYVQMDCGEISVKIPTIYGLFCDCSNAEIEQGYLSIGLNFVEKEDKRYGFSFADDLYVNPYTYEMARSQLNGFVKTKYLYLPKNGFHDFESIKLNVNATNLGVACINMTYDVYIESDKSRIGNCVTSQYCIRTGDAIFIDGGKELKHD